MSTIKISQLGNLTAALANVQIPMVANVAGTLTTVKGNVGQISSFILGNLTTTDLANISSNVTALQGQVSTLEANAATQAGAISILTANAGAQSDLIDSLDSNVGAQLGLIYALQDDVANLTANAGAQSDSISTLTSNAASQGELISALESNISVLISNAGAQSTSISNLEANVDVILGNIAAQDSLISNIQGNLSSLSQDIDDINATIDEFDSDIGNLIANAESQQAQIDSLGAVDLESIESNITALFSAIGVHTGEIYDLQSNAAAQQDEILELQSNAAAQAAEISALGNTSAITANISILQSNVVTLTSSLSSVQSNVTTLQSNVTTLNGNISTLTANAGTQSAAIAAVESNVSILQSNVASLVAGNVAMKGYVDAQISANITALVSGAPATLDTLNELAAALGDDANLSVTITNRIANVESNIATLTSNAGVQSGNISVLQSAVGSLTSNAVSQQTAITNITNGTATFGNLIPSANVTYSLGSPTAQWKELWVSGNTIHIGGQSITTTDSGIILTGNLATTGGVYEVAEFWDQTGFIGSGPWITPPVLYETSYPTNSPAPSFIVDANVAGYVSNVSVDYKGVYPYEQIDLYSGDGISPLYDLAEPVEFVDILGEDVKPFGGANATSFADNITYTGTIYNGTVQIELTVSKIINAPATDDEFIDITVTNLVATGTTVADLIGRTVYIKNDGFVYDTLDATEINGTSELTLQDPAFYAKLTNPRTATGDRISYYTSPVGQSNLVPASTNQAISTNTGIFNIAQVTGDLIVNGNVSVDGNIGFTMANFQHWTSNVSTIADALNQLAERIWNIENP